MSSPTRLKVAVVGTGISGLSAAWLLHPRHDVTIYEKAGRIGGHSNTVSAKIGGAELAVDAGFIVFNPVTYPNFVQFCESSESRAALRTCRSPCRSRAVGYLNEAIGLAQRSACQNTG